MRQHYRYTRARLDAAADLGGVLAQMPATLECDDTVIEVHGQCRAREGVWRKGVPGVVSIQLIDQNLARAVKGKHQLGTLLHTQQRLALYQRLLLR
jgi:hypothetical protein